MYIYIYIYIKKGNAQSFGGMMKYFVKFFSADNF